MLQFPGMTDDDIKVFLVEADEQLQFLEDGLLALEQSSDDPEVIAQIFRAAHTLKGSSATLGHDKMARLTHSMESALDLVRKSRIEVTSTLMDLLFECLDMLRILNREISTAQDSGADITALNERLLDVIEGVDGQEGAGASTHASARASADESACAGGLAGPGDVKIRVTFTKTCPMPSVRAYQVVDRLSALGSIAFSHPGMDRIEAGDDISDLVVVVEYDGDALEPLIEAARDVSDVESACVLQVGHVGSTRATAAAAAAAA
ncbi:MAG TPA: hypothetical protein DCL63_02300, partial [Firmicutes bacterium]|nr:hypothetical protein [Bacillota bacterium]